MNLTKLFNKKYFIQNFKKSRGPLLVILSLVPLLNFLILLVSSINSQKVSIVTMNNLSVLNIIGTFFIPSVISFCLFGYILKRKSVDFINSMPIDRKSIFITNTIGGVCLIILMNLLNTLLITFVTSTFGNYTIPLLMLFDYFILWTIVYSFVFIVTNFAISLSGNIITTVVLVGLLLCFLPFIRDYKYYSDYYRYDNEVKIKCDNEACKPEKYYCGTDKLCNEFLDKGIYSTNLTKTDNVPQHVAPYSYLSSVFYDSFNLFDVKTLIITVILGVVLFFGGLISFIKRKMEICETSFESLTIHNIVKALVLTPFLLIAYEAEVHKTIYISIIIALIAIYYLIYDLIVRRKINLNLKSILGFVLTIIFIITIGITNTSIINNKETLLDIDKIDEVAISFNSEFFTNDIYINDRNIINFAVKNILTNDSYYDEDLRDNYVSYKFLSNNKVYSTNRYLNKSDYNMLIKLLNSNNEYINYLKTVKDSNVYAISINNSVYKNKQELLNDIKGSLSNIDLVTYLNKVNTSNILTDIKLYSYENHQVISRRIPVNLSKDIEKHIIKYYKNKINNDLNSNKFEHISNLYFSLNNYSIFSDIADEEYQLDYVIDNSKKELINFVKDHEFEDVNNNEEFFVLSIYVFDEEYSFVTNDIDGFKTLLKNRYNILKDTEEYKNLLVDMEVDYYD